jgi:hypothetical protein
LSKKPRTTKTLEALSTKIAFDLQLPSSSEESKTDSQLNAKYEANMRALGHGLNNWQFKKCHCQISQQCAVSSKTDAATLHKKGVLHSMVQDTHGRM